jgi:hypothetical protein
MAHLISAGVLASVCPRGLIEEVLAQTGKASCVFQPIVDAVSG